MRDNSAALVGLKMIWNGFTGDGGWRVWTLIVRDSPIHPQETKAFLAACREEDALGSCWEAGALPARRPSGPQAARRRQFVDALESLARWPVRVTVRVTDVA
jgi:hypothetical protein